MQLNWNGASAFAQFSTPEVTLDCFATQGLDEGMVAGLLGVSEDEFRSILASNLSWQAAWNHGRAEAKARVSQALWKIACAGDAAAAKLWLLGLLV